MEQPGPPRFDDPGDLEVAERLQWLLRLRWLIVPVFVAVDLANDLLMSRDGAWTAIAVGAGLLAANGIYGLALANPRAGPLLVRWARVECLVVVAVPVVLVALHRDPANALRYGVLVGVVGAAVVLRTSGEVALVAMWAITSLIVGDAIAVRFEPSRIGPGAVAQWAMEAGIIGTVAMLATYLQSTREWNARQLRDAAEGLERAKAEWEAAFDVLHEMVFVTDGAGRVIRVNRAFAKILGARPHELAGRRLPELLAGHPSRWWSLPGDGIAEVEDPLFDTVFEIVSTRLGTRTLRVARDVGEVRRLYARLVQADKLAGVGALASGVAHEVNNPTAFVSSNLAEIARYVAAYEAALAEVETLATDPACAERVGALLGGPELAYARREAANAVAESQEGMDRIRQLATNLRAIARQDPSGEPAAPVDLAEVIRAVTRTAAGDLRAAGARVETPDTLWVLGHRGELVDVVLNLVVNAVQSREEGRPNHIHIALEREGPSAVLRVADTGRGISPAHVKKLYQPFFTTKAPGEGTGLGLSLARKIVLAHGGSIDVSTEVGVGSTFTVHLPAVDADPARMRRPA